MKKVLILLLSFILLVSIASCGKEEKSKYEKILEQLENSDFEKYEFTKATIELNVSDLKKNGLAFEGKVKNIAQFTKPGSSIEKDGFYVYEFELAKDAEAFYDYAMKLAAESRMSGNVVVYGWNEIIRDIDM